VENIEKIDIQPYIMKEEQHVVRKEVQPILKKESKHETKKVIQPIIKDIIQPIHVKVKPIVQEGIKPTIIQENRVSVVNQGTRNLPASFTGTKVEREVMSSTSVKQSIVKSNILPTEYKTSVVKPEIRITKGEGGEGGSSFGNARFSSGVNREIDGGTTIKPSIFKNSVLPTIDGGTTVLKTVFGGTTTSINMESAEGVAFGGTNNVSMQYNMGISGQNGNIMGVGGGVGDNAADVTYSTKPDGGNNFRMATTKKIS
jgi:hypothetical protein